MTLACADVDFDLKLAEFKINGYVVFEDMIPEGKIDRIREAFLPLLAHIQARETEVSHVELGDPRIGDFRRQLVHVALIDIDRQYLVAQIVQRLGQVRPEASQSQHRDLHVGS